MFHKRIKKLMLVSTTSMLAIAAKIEANLEVISNEPIVKLQYIPYI